MSLYIRVHTPNSPLLPLSPMPSSSLSSSTAAFLSPYTASLGSRRSFTPNHLNILPPPSLSPIRAGILSSKRKSCDLHRDRVSPESIFKRPLPVASTQKSMKKVRSSVRKEEVRNTHAQISLDPIRRTLFAADSPPICQVKMSPNVSRIDFAHLKTPQSKRSMYLTPQRYSPAAAAAAASSIHYERYESFASPHCNEAPSLLDETFTVMSILKEIRMQKYANLFASEEVDLFVFLMLTYQDMAELGIEEDDRVILMSAINCFTEFFGNPENNFM